MDILFANQNDELLNLNNRSFRLLFAALICALCVYAAGPRAYADSASDSAPITETEKIGFAFYKLAKRNPPFADWIKQTDDYKLMKPSMKQGYLDKGIARLSKAFVEYLPDDNLLYLRTSVRVKIPNGQKAQAYERMGVRKPVQLIIDSAVGNYFPVEVGGMWIAVVPKNIDDYLFLSLDEDQYTALTTRLGMTPVGSIRAAVLELRLRPVQVDTSKPAELDGISAWLMMAEIASLTLWNNDRHDTMAWEYSADWYVPQQQRDLLNLYDR